jgi:hypothetical protein
MGLWQEAGWHSGELLDVIPSVLVDTTRFPKWKNDTFWLYCWLQQLLQLRSFFFL